MQKRREGLKLQSSVVLALQEAGEAFLVGLLEQADVCYTCQTSDHYAKGHTASTQNPGGFLSRSKRMKLIKDKNMLILEDHTA